MKKYLLALLILISALSLTACGHKHTWSNASCIEPKTCSECGKTEGDALGHAWTEATCTEPKTCSRCGETEGLAKGHSVGEWIRVEDTEEKENRVCTACGEVVETRNAPSPRPIAVDENGLCVTGEEFSEQLAGLIAGKYVDYQEYSFPIRVTQESKDQEAKNAIYYLDLNSGTAFQMTCGLMDKTGKVTTAKTTDTAQSISVWGLINVDDDMLNFQGCAVSMIYLTQTDDDTYSTAAGIMRELTQKHFGKFAKYGSVEYMFDFYPEAYGGKDAVFFTLRNIL